MLVIITVCMCINVQCNVKFINKILYKNIIVTGAVYIANNL